MAPPSCMETEKRHAVLRKMRSKYSSSLMRWPSFRSELAELGLDLRAGVSDGSAELHGDGKKARGLAENEVEVFLFVDEMAELLHLQQLALDHLLGEGDEQVEDAEVAFFEGGGEGLHVEPVAGQDALGIAPCGVGGGTAAAEFGLVDDVVVDQGGGVEHLDDGAETDARMAGAAECFGGEQEEQGTDALAAAGHQVLGYVGDDVDLGGRLAYKLLLDRGEIVVEEVEDLF